MNDDTPAAVRAKQVMDDLHVRAQLWKSSNPFVRALEHFEPDDGTPLRECFVIRKVLAREGELHLLSSNWWNGPGPTASVLPTRQ